MSSVPAKTILTYFINLYEKKYLRKYPVNWAKHGGIIKNLQKLYEDMDIYEFIYSFLQSPDPFYIERGHSLELLNSYIPKFLGKLNIKASGQVKTSDYELLE